MYAMTSPGNAAWLTASPMNARPRKTTNAPITLGAYGTGPNPKILRNQATSDICILLTDASYWKISDLEVGRASVGILLHYTQLFNNGITISRIVAHDNKGIWGGYSTEYPVLEAAMKLYGGKPIINSINFEDGEDAAEKRVKLARRFGAAVIALTIDERGMAKEVDDKIAVAQRLYEFACVKHGLPPSDLLFDPLTFTICTGNEDDRKLGLNTLDAIERIRKTLPECQIILGLSNISFGLNPPARQVLNSVFLDHALKRGMTGAIVHFSRILPQHRVRQLLS